MSAINYGRVVVGGLVAGVVLNVLDVVNGMFIMAGDFEANAARLGLDPALMQASSVMVTWIVIDFLIGMLLVWLYAAIRPRFGPGLKTALIAGLYYWAGVSLVLYGFTAMGYFGTGLFWKATVMQLPIALAGAAAGAWAYKEA
jgi:hypothetical protein